MSDQTDVPEVEAPEVDGPLTVPEDAGDDWQPEGYEPGPDDPGDVTDECGAEIDHIEGKLF